MKNKITLLVMLLLVLSAYPILALDEGEITKINELSLAERIGQLNENVERSCEDAIISYRSELTRVVEEQEDILITKLEEMYRKERILLFSGVLIASFIGATLAIAIQKVIFNKKDEEIRGEMCTIINEYYKKKQGDLK